MSGLRLPGQARRGTRRAGGGSTPDWFPFGGAAPSPNGDKAPAPAATPAGAAPAAERSGIPATPLIAGALAFVLLALAIIWFWPGAGTVQATAHFPRAVGLFVGSDVRILGVKVGEVSEVVPEGTSVRVEFEYDDKYKVPSDAKAAVVAPSVVSDRYVQLHAGLQGRPDPRRRRRHPAGADRDAGRAGPDLLQPQRPQRGPRPRGRQQGRRSQPAAEGRGRQPRRPGRRTSTPPSTTSPRRSAPSPTARTTCSAPCATCRSSPRRWPRTTSRSGRSTRTSRASPTSWRGSGKSSPPR